MLIPRLYSKRLTEAAADFPALVLTGPRQSGKTTLLRQLFRDYSYVSLDLPSTAEAANSDPASFFRAYPPPVLVDEVQYAPGLFRHVKALIDQDRDAMGRFILTGSQSFLLMKSISDSLAGRCVWFELENLGLSELAGPDLVDAKALDWPGFLVRGQFPELWKRTTLSSADFLRSYLATYLERDVRQILNVNSLRDFERFIRLLAARSGNLLNKTELAKDVGVASRTIGDWVSVLEASGQIVLLQPWFRNFSKRMVKTPKVYFRDSGLLCQLLGLDEDSLPRSPFLGAVWEGFVFAELRKLAAPLERPGKFWFYRDQSGREVDIIHEKNGTLDFVDCKWTEHPDQEDGRSLFKIANELAASDNPERPGRKLVVSRSPETYHLGNSLQLIHPADLNQIL
jgi:predicted AAA+ superfamily ATPase